MRKLMTIGLMLLIATLTFAGDGMNDFKTPLGSSFTPASTDRIHLADISAIATTENGKSYVTWSWLIDYLSDEYTVCGNATVDTNTIVADASAATQTISLEAGDLLCQVGIYINAAWDASDFIEFNNADSNATTLDTLNFGTGTGWHSNLWYFYAPQDTVIYINLGDTVTVASTTNAKLKWTICR